LPGGFRGLFGRFPDCAIITWGNYRLRNHFLLTVPGFEMIGGVNIFPATGIFDNIGSCPPISGTAVAAVRYKL
jgi:hypothetical protein